METSLKHIPTENTKQTTCLSCESARTVLQHMRVWSARPCGCYGSMSHRRAVGWVNTPSVLDLGQCYPSNSKAKLTQDAMLEWRETSVYLHPNLDFIHWHPDNPTHSLPTCYKCRKEAQLLLNKTKYTDSTCISFSNIHTPACIKVIYELSSLKIHQCSSILKKIKFY